MTKMATSKIFELSAAALAEEAGLHVQVEGAGQCEGGHVARLQAKVRMQLGGVGAFTRKKHA